MAAAGMRAICVYHTFSCPPEDIIFADLEVFLRGVDDPWVGVGSASPNTNPQFQRAKLHRDANDRVEYRPGLIDTTVTSRYGCPSHEIVTWPVVHNTGAPGSPDLNQGLFQVMPPSDSYYVVRYRVYVKNATSGLYEDQGPCETVVQHEWLEASDTNGCVPAGRNPFDPNPASSIPTI